MKIKPTKRERLIARRLARLAKDMEAAGLALFSGHSDYTAVLLREDSGLVLSHIPGHCWAGSDPDYWKDEDGNEWCVDWDEFDPGAHEGYGRENWITMRDKD